MAKLHQVAVRRIGKRGAYALRCAACGQEIEYGKPYKWFKRKSARGGVKMSYHPACTIPPSHKTTSRMGLIYDVRANLDFSSCESAEDCQSVLNELAEAVREVEGEYRESVESMESGFGHRTSQADELEGRAEALEAWADELENWELGTGVDEPEGDEPEGGSDEWDAYRDDLRDSAQQLAEECPL